MSTDTRPDTGADSGFPCPRCKQPKTDRPDRAGPCTACATELRTEADARFEAWKARHDEQVQAAGSDAVRCSACGFDRIPDEDDRRCPLCGEGTPT